MEKGLTEKEAKKRLLQHGANVIITQKAISAWEIFLSQFPSIVNFILAGAAVLSFALGEIIDGAFILVILVLNALFGFFQEFKAEKAAAKLKQFIIQEARVMRDGKEKILPVSQLVPGDLVVVSEGDKIAADGVLVDGTHIEIDESILTGEALPVLKTIQGESSLFMGTVVMRGHGKMLVEKTGAKTRFGQIAKTLAEIEKEKTPLHKQIDKLGSQLVVVIILIALSIVAIGLVQGRDFFLVLLTAVSIAVAAIPEGLPAVITIALALGMQRMAKKKAIVRKMVAIETLGATQVILTDKTGTLTQNKMRVKKFFSQEKSLDSLLRACILGNTASLVKKEDGPTSWDVVGDKTDGALLLWAKDRLGEKLEDFQQQGKVVDEYSFNPISKTITVVWQKNGGKYEFTRGAPEKLLLGSDLKETEKAVMEKAFQEYAREGLRIIAFGVKKESGKKLKLLGFVGIYDPPRIEAKAAINLAKQAGIRTVMVTGDNPVTAEAVAREIGLIEKNEDIITGEELDKMNDEEFNKMLLKTRIWARVKPQDKLRLVESYQKKGFIVGVTGDGVNDVLALKKANVGVAMGESGTDVAKEASDIVLADDNFSTLVHAIEEGRTIYQNVVKAITYLLSGNLSEISLVFFASLLGLPPPLLPTQILWINLVTDGIPALALAGDVRNPGLIKQSPRDPAEPILNKNRIYFISLVGLALSIILLVAFFLLVKFYNEGLARTVTFNMLIFLHLAIAFVIRGKSLLAVNKLLLIGVFVTIILQIIITTTPALREIFHLW